LPARFLAVLFPVFLVFFAAMSMPPANLGSRKLPYEPEVCCKTYIATYCDLSTKKVQWVPLQWAILAVKTLQHLRARQLSSIAHQADWQD
jgi:hypothetical protein